MVLYQDLSVSAGGATGGLYLSAVSGRIKKLSVQRFERVIRCVISTLSDVHVKWSSVPPEGLQGGGSSVWGAVGAGGGGNKTSPKPLRF